MAGRGPAPKPAHLRQRTNHMPGAATIAALPESTAPAIPNPDSRAWHRLTLESWARAWASEMASQWLASDADALGRLAILWDEFYHHPDAKVLAEIRLQEQRFGLSPLDRSRLRWEVAKADEAERKRPAPPAKRATDPRKLLMMATR